MILNKYQVKRITFRQYLYTCQQVRSFCHADVDVGRTCFCFTVVERAVTVAALGRRALIALESEGAMNQQHQNNQRRSDRHVRCSAFQQFHFISSFHELMLMQSCGVRLPSVCLSVCLSVNFCANRFFYQTYGWIATKLAHPGCAQGQGRGQRLRDTGTSVMSRNVCLYGLTFCRYMHSLYEAPLHSPYSITISQLYTYRSNV